MDAGIHSYISTFIHNSRINSYIPVFIHNSCLHSFIPALHLDLISVQRKDWSKCHTWCLWVLGVGGMVRSMEIVKVW